MSLVAGLVHRLLRRLALRRERDLWACASRVEREMPNLAAELRFIAVHRAPASS